MTRCVAGAVLKIAPPPGVEGMTYERGAMSIESNTLELIRTHTSVPVPDVHLADRSHEVCDADYPFMPYIDADNLDEVTEPCLAEWDLWEGNVTVRDGRIVAIVDHERAFHGDSPIEVGFAATQLPVFGDSTALMRGHGHPELTETQRVRRRLYGLHLLSVMAIETVYRGHTDTTQYDWARARPDDLMALFGHARR